jgi:hypothetical protein
VLAGDLNGDGAPDLAVMTDYLGGSPAHVGVLLNLGFAGPAPALGGQAPWDAPLGPEPAGAASLDPAGSPGIVAAAFLASPSRAQTPAAESAPTALPTTAVSPADQLAAVLVPDDLGPVAADRRPAGALALDDRLAGEAAKDGCFLHDLFATGLTA